MRTIIRQLPTAGIEGPSSAGVARMDTLAIIPEGYLPALHLHQLPLLITRVERPERIVDPVGLGADKPGVRVQSRVVVEKGSRRTARFGA